MVKARSADISRFDVNASPKIVKHAKTHHFRGSPRIPSDILSGISIVDFGPDH